VDLEIRNSCCPPQSVYGISRAADRVSPRLGLLSCGLPASRSQSPCPCAVLVWRSPLRGWATLRSTDTGLPRFYPVRIPSTGFSSAPECYPSIPAHDHHLTACFLRSALSRFVPLQRNPTAKSHHPRGFRPPGHVASLRFWPASTPCSLDNLPDMFQTGALVGFPLQSLTWQRSHRLSTICLPSCDWLYPASPAIRVAPNPTCTGQTRFHASGPRFRGFVPLPVGIASDGFPRFGMRPGSPGFPPPWGLPRPLP